MRPYAILTFGVVLATCVAPRPAKAQFGYPGGYGGYGWGGWGATPQGDIARGLGAFNAGVGQANLADAEAQSINTDTVMRWNQALWSSQHALNASNYLRRRQRQAINDAAQAAIYDRLRNHPETYDIQTGDALNVLLDILQNPAVSGSSYRLARAPLSREVIQDIPFEYASEAMTICLDQITNKDGWPIPLRDDAFSADRKAVQDAIKTALEEDEHGDLRPKTIQAVGDTINKLRIDFEKAIPTTSGDYIPTRDFIKGMAGLTKMLHSPRVDEILAELEKYEGTTVGDLLAFMQAFNLRFAPAKSFRQRQIYLRLYPILAEAVNGPLSGLAQKAEQEGKGIVQSAEKAASEVGSAASSFFKGMSWPHLGGDGKSQ